MSWIGRTRRTAHALVLACAIGAFPPSSFGPGPAHAENAPLERAGLFIESAAGPLEFEVEVARTPEQRARGLMFRTALAPDAGMLFLFENERPVRMWMMNTFISLDMLFIGRDWRIRAIAERTTPRSEAGIHSGGPVIAVVELPGGSAERLAIRPGDRVRLAPTAPAPE